eukprot:TRINITY_DN21922_c0_g1_i1.p1 TRINITY_DN21922_c0_g1~~TRINITY_DN21922_c0_g1_i1.p1  ORF type:complete len:328 (-),score=111.90 TRINITY_DN21922_c0_g1_i1:84-1067(-)
MERTATIYFSSVNNGREFFEVMKRLKSMLVEMQFERKGIVEVDVSRDIYARDRIYKLLGKPPKKNFPIIFIDSELIGDISDFEKWSSKSTVVPDVPTPLAQLEVNSEDDISGSDVFKQIETIRNDTNIKRSTFVQNTLKVTPAPSQENENEWTEHMPNPSNGPSSDKESSSSTNAPNVSSSVSVAKSNLNVFGKAGEYFESTVNSWYNWIGKNPSNTPVQSSQDDFQDVVVIHTNWFWKQQVRILRFYEHYFNRIHPNTLNVKETHPYKEVDKITITGNTYFIIYFLPSSKKAPEYYESKDRDAIIEIIATRALREGQTVALVEIAD